MKFLAKLKYLVPSAITALSLWYAIRSLMEPDLALRCWYLLCCVLIDKLDGTMARLLKATSKFGVKFDSFADAIAFGVAPGVILFQSAHFLSDSAFVYSARVIGLVYIFATFYRLYKFDKMANSKNPPDYFIGIPSTLSAAIFAAFCVAFEPYLRPEHVFFWFLPVLSLLLSFLMNGSFPTLKVGIPKNRFLLGLQVVTFAFLIYGVFTRSFPQILFLISLVVFAIGVIGGRKKASGSAT